MNVSAAPCRVRPEATLVRALIVEADPDASDLLVNVLARQAGASVDVTRSFAEAEQRLLHGGYDVAFLDIESLGDRAFELVPLMRAPARMVFLADSERHALRAFDVNALDYIVKPLTAHRLGECLRRVNEARAVVPAERPRRQGTDRVFLQRTDGGGFFARLEEIAMVLSSENYSEVILLSGERTIVRRTMRSWEGVLPLETFYRVHRTAIVNLTCAERVSRATTRARLFMRGHVRPVPVSRRIWRRLQMRIAAFNPV